MSKYFFNYLYLSFSTIENRAKSPVFLFLFFYFFFLHTCLLTLTLTLHSIVRPVVISIVPDICEAPIPSVKQILGAKKKPSTALTLDGIGLSAANVAPLLTVASVKAPQTSRKAICLNADGASIEEAATKLVKQLAADGVL